MKTSGIILFSIASLTCGARAAEFTPTTFEDVPPGESAQISEVVALTGKLLELRYGSLTGEGAANTMARRAVHPKSHGCVKANFTVNAAIPEKYRVGVFATPGKTYRAWIRFSNATAVLGPDLRKDRDGRSLADSRGMAIKLMGVEGDTLMQEPGGKTQDFLLINQRMFAFPNVAEYLAFTKIQFDKADRLDAVIPVFLNPPTEARAKIIKIVGAVIQPTQLANPLDADYFSASPFLYGKDKVAKFAATPRNPAKPSNNPDQPTSDYLREAMKANLAVGGGEPVVYDFQVQLRPDGLQPMDAEYPVESANDEWKPKSDGTAAYQNVATITIHRQNFDNPLQNTECEHLVFTPWHGLLEHQPIGGINRMRRQVYIESASRRAEHREPTDYPQWPTWP